MNHQPEEILSQEIEEFGEWKSRAIINNVIQLVGFSTNKLLDEGILNYLKSFIV